MQTTIRHMYNKSIRYFRAASHVRAFKKVTENWYGLMIHFTSIFERTTDDFDQDAKTKAQTNVKFLTNRNSMAVLFFCLDVLNILSRFSVLAQRQYSTIIEQRQRENELRDSLIAVKSNFGPKMKEFLHEAMCKNDDGTISACDTLERYESASSVTYKTYPMNPTKNVNQFPLLSSLYVRYLDELVSKFSFYFPLQITKDTPPSKIDTGVFDSLNHHQWPKFSPQKDTFVPGSIEKLARLTNVRFSPALQTQFNSLVKRVLTEGSFWCDHNADDSLMFWVSVIRKYHSEMSSDLIHSILTSAGVTMSSADSERSFSAMNRSVIPTQLIFWFLN